MTDADVLALLNTGRNNMPAAPQISEGDRKKLLDFLFVRDRKLPAAPEDRPHYTFNGYNFLLDNEGYPGSTPPWGTLNCIDLNTGKLRWKVPLGEYAELKAAGVPQTGQESFGGAITTAGGLVFVTGTLDKKLRAFDSETGAELWAHELPLYGTAPPSTYEVNGVQYVVVVATGGGKLNGPVGDGFVAFKLLR
jgi:quinoprotein glucose dehydrogenase